jgi:hypothetical protein
MAIKAMVKGVGRIWKHAAQWPLTNKSLSRQIELVLFLDTTLLPFAFGNADLNFAKS